MSAQGLSEAELDQIESEIDPEQQRVSAEEQRNKLLAASGAVLQKLSAMADVEVGAKQPIEQRWLEDLRQYHGKHDKATLDKIDEAGGSRLFANQTRPKTTAWAARFGDMLFPTDDKNWGILPTPVPTMEGADAVQRAQSAARAASRASQMGDTAGEQAAVQEAQQAGDLANANAQLSQEATKRCEAMSKLIDDQLGECGYNQYSREVILDACKLGTGIMKGPVIGPKARRSWSQISRNIFKLKQKEDPRPSYMRVDPWNFFPDSSATRIEDAEYTFERHLPTKKEINKWMKAPGFNKDGLKTLLMSEPKASPPDYLGQLRSMQGIDANASDKSYLVWEYHGAVSIGDMATLALANGDDQMLSILEHLARAGDEDVQAIIWFAADGNILLRYGLHPLESGDTLYSVFNFDKDETSIFGYGIPYLMRDSQAAFAAAWRMMMDNAALSSGPQIVINKQNIEPENGSYKLEPRKVWLKKNDTLANMQPDFDVHQIECRTDLLTSVLNLAKQFTDDETNMPPIAYGESGSHITKTAQGISMLMNSVNVIFRHVVKNWDDQITVPNIRRIYDWNMQFAANDNVKGDFDVQARGSSVLLVREIQSQNLMNLATAFVPSPIFGPMLKAIAVLRKTVASFLINPDEVVKTDAEYEKDMAAQAEAAKDAIDPQTQGKIKLAERMHELRMVELEAEGRLAMAQAAAKGTIEMDKLREMLSSKERLFSAEAALTPAKTSGGGGIL